MLDKLKKEIAVEKESLNRLIGTHDELLRKCSTTPPNAIEISALSAMLHSFYTGVENLFKRIAVYLDGGPPAGEFWHSQLLDSMSNHTPKRPAVISESLRDQLRSYLNFRHVFRHAYSFELQWTKMAPLVLECKNTLRVLEEQLDSFVEKVDPGQSGASAESQS